MSQTTDYIANDYLIKQQEIDFLFGYLAINPLDSVLLFLKDNECVIHNEFEIRNFIIGNPSVADYLYEAPSIIFKYFGRVRMSLELFLDPEIKNDNGKLFLNILTDLEPKEALDKLGKIDKEWLLSVIGSDISKFNINIEII
jgi:hypothetical protein